MIWVIVDPLHDAYMRHWGWWWVNVGASVQKHGTADVWPWYLNRLENPAWIRRLGFESPSGRDSFYLKNFEIFTRTPVCRKRMLLPAQLTYQMLTLLKCLALIAQYVTAFGMNPKVGGSSPPQGETFSVSKLWHFHKKARSCVENECCRSRTVNNSNVSLTSKMTKRMDASSTRLATPLENCSQAMQLNILADPMGRLLWWIISTGLLGRMAVQLTFRLGLQHRESPGGTLWHAWYLRHHKHI